MMLAMVVAPRESRHFAGSSGYNGKLIHGDERLSNGEGTMVTKLTTRGLLVVLAVSSLSLVVRAQTYPRTLVASAEVSGATSGATATITIRIERLMPDFDFKAVVDGLKFGGYPGALTALRKLPEIGYVQIGDRRTVLKYAHQRADGKSGLVLVTDRPIFFVGGGAPDAKPKAGYELGVIELQVDAQGNGQGTMAAAARVKPGPDGGVILDDYAATPVRLSLKPGK